MGTRVVWIASGPKDIERAAVVLFASKGAKVAVPGRRQVRGVERSQVRHWSHPQRRANTRPTNPVWTRKLRRANAAVIFPRCVFAAFGPCQDAAAIYRLHVD